MENKSTGKGFVVLGVVLLLIIIAFFVGRSIRKEPVMVPNIEISSDLSEEESIEILPESDIDIETETETEEQENITTPLYVKSVYQKSGRWWADVDYVTHLGGIEALEYAINSGFCTISGMTKSATLTLARQQTVSSIQDSVFYNTPSCPLDWYIAFEFGQDVNQSGKIRSFPFASNYRMINYCPVETFSDFTPQGLSEYIAANEYDQDYKYGLYATYAFMVPRAVITNGEIQQFDFVNGCAG